jgi:hypothetical protein
VRIIVGIGPRLLESVDGGRTWTGAARTVPAPTEPSLRGVRDDLTLRVPTGWTLDYVHIGAEGIGIAAGREPVLGDRSRDSTAKYWLTRDGGVSWQAVQPDIGIWGRLRAGFSWPPEYIDSVVVLAGGLVALVWEDPWIFEGPHNHIVLSADEGASWRYARLRDGYWPACGPEPLRIFGAGRVAVRSESGSFRREIVRLDWKLPPGYWDDPVPLRFPQFTSEAEGFALVVSWPRDVPLRSPEELGPPLVGLARCQDGGRLWKVVSTWEGPRSTDLNRRHEITLDVW